MPDLQILLLSAVSIATFLLCLRGFDPSNLVGGAPGEWTEIGSIFLFAFPVSVIGFLTLTWAKVNLPEFAPILDIYIYFFLAIAVVYVGEVIAYEKYPLAALLGDPSLESVVSGGILGLIWLTLSQPMTILELPKATTSAIILVMMVMLEEMAFASVSAPSLAEFIGVIPTLILNSLFFGFFHYYVYQANLNLIIRAMLFRIAADSLTLRHRSFIPAATAHLVANTSFILSLVS